jgi:hypothetical protein
MERQDRAKLLCSALDYLHCPFFLRSSIVIARFELQTRPAPPWGFRFWHMLIQAFKSQLTASAGDGANAAVKDEEPG